MNFHQQQIAKKIVKDQTGIFMKGINFMWEVFLLNFSFPMLTVGPCEFPETFLGNVRIKL
jgi:hypothetical protein